MSMLFIPGLAESLGQKLAVGLTLHVGLCAASKVMLESKGIASITLISGCILMHFVLTVVAFFIKQEPKWLFPVIRELVASLSTKYLGITLIATCDGNNGKKLQMLTHLLAAHFLANLCAMLHVRGEEQQECLGSCPLQIWLRSALSVFPLMLLAGIPTPESAGQSVVEFFPPRVYIHSQSLLSSHDIHTINTLKVRMGICLL